MNRRQFVEVIGRELGDAEVADAALSAFVEVVRDAVASGDGVKIWGFGRWSRRRRPPLPKVPATYVPRFDPGQGFRDAVSSRRRVSSASHTT